MAEYITKKQVIEWFSCYGHEDKQIRFEDLSFDIQHMIPEDVAPVVHGQWILVDTDKWIGVCSNCNRQDSIDHLAKHCRFCGARMDLEEPNEAKESRQP